MLRLLFVIILLLCSLANATTCPAITDCSASTIAPVAGPDATTNCRVNKDSGCPSGYCGTENDNSPINISNLFGVVINTILDLGQPPWVMSRVHAMVLGDPQTEGAYVKICDDQGAWAGSNVNYGISNPTCKNKNSNSICGMENGNWVGCNTYVYMCSTGICSYKECSYDAGCTKKLQGNFEIVQFDDNGCPNPCAASPNMAKPAVNGNSFVTDSKGNQLYCPLTRGNVPSNDFWFKLDDDTRYITDTGIYDPRFSLGFDSDLLLNPWVDAINLGKFNIVQSGDRTCLEVWFFGLSALVNPWTTVGCKYSLPPVPTGSGSVTCYVGDACTGKELQTLSKFSLLGQLMQCVTETLSNLFVTPPNKCNTTGLILTFQQNMRQVVSALLTLYVIAMGIKILAGGEIPKKSELFMFILKFGLVIYFSVGTFNINDPNSSNDNTNGLTFIYNHGFAIMSALSNDLIQAGNSADNGFCVFPPQGAQYTQGYEYLALWDSLDCRISSYLGFTSMEQGASKTMSVLTMIWVFFIGFNPVMSIFLTVFAFFMISVMILLVNIFILSMFGLAFVVFVGPIFVPMSLFSFTKQYFEQWLSLLFSFILQPAVISAGLALMMVVLDHQLYAINIDADGNYISGCKFIMTSTDNSTNHWYSQYADGCSSANSTSCTGCSDSLGYFISAMELSDFGQVTSILGTASIIQPTGIGKSLINQFMTLALMLFLFYEFAEILANLSADITGGMSLGQYAATPSQARAFLSKALQATRALGRKALAQVYRGGRGTVKAIGNKVSRKKLSSGSEAAGGGAGSGVGSDNTSNAAAASVAASSTSSGSTGTPARADATTNVESAPAPVAASSGDSGGSAGAGAAATSGGADSSSVRGVASAAPVGGSDVTLPAAASGAGSVPLPVTSASVPAGDSVTAPATPGGSSNVGVAAAVAASGAGLAPLPVTSASVPAGDSVAAPATPVGSSNVGSAAVAAGGAGSVPLPGMSATVSGGDRASENNPAASERPVVAAPAGGDRNAPPPLQAAASAVQPSQPSVGEGNAMNSLRRYHKMVSKARTSGVVRAPASSGSGGGEPSGSSGK